MNVESNLCLDQSSINITNRTLILDCFDTVPVPCVALKLPYPLNYPGDLSVWIREYETPINPSLQRQLTQFELCSFYIIRIIETIPYLSHKIILSKFSYDDKKILAGDDYFVVWEFEFGEFIIESIVSLVSV